MFRSSRRNQADSKKNDANVKSELGPLDELTSLIDELKEAAVDTPMKAFLESLVPASLQDKSSSSTKRSSVLDSWKKLRIRKKASDDNESTEEAGSSDALSPSNSKSPLSSTDMSDTSSTAATTPKTPSSHFNFASKGPNARFLPTISQEEQERFVEIIRRISELVVIGERAAATTISEKAKLDILSEEDDKDEYNRAKKKLVESEPYASVFEFFFERNTLSFITDILTGRAFDLIVHLDKQKRVLQAEKTEKEGEVSTSADGDTSAQDALEVIEHKLKGLNAIDLESEENNGVILLPPLAVATQGFQSVSILVQNVKRATSLFFILSNNHVNQLIDFPLDEYHIAERKKFQQADTFMSPRRFGSPELAELTTTFVTFLKSLALRMNAETLQFFLTYPADTAIESDTDYLADQVEEDQVEADEDEEEIPMDEIASNSTVNDSNIQMNRPVSVKHIEVEFPLYERALEFCSAHHDSFVRVTAMNICLNTLRLTTVAPKQGEDDPEADLDAAASGSSPDAILHNAKALPMRERLAIAQYVCTPFRVERLASPIFTKLAQLWGVLEEQFREMDSAAKSIQGRTAMSKDAADEDPTSKKKAVNEKVARAREKARRTKFSGIFNDASYNLQDELLLLEDLLRVGLTSFNEQTIEMMFATFVYPLLLQPLLLYFQRSGVSADVLFADVIDDHIAGRIKPPDESGAESVKSLIAAPAKSALFCLAAVFQFLTNPPLLRLLFTAVFHPLSPDATGETMIRAKADVACIGPDGKATIRIDSLDENGKVKCESDRSTYIFGTVTGRKEVSGRRGNKGNSDTCVFVLAPALVEILEFKGDDGGLVARSRHNPYRKAIFQCFTLSKDVSDLQPLSIIAVDSAVSVFEKEFLADMLFGLDIKRYRDKLSSDERTESFKADLDLDDRDIGNGPAMAVGESRLSLGAPAEGKVGFDYMNEVISSFKRCLINAVPGGQGTWRLEYDMIAAHALLSSIRGNAEAILKAYQTIDGRCRQASAFFSETPLTIDEFAGDKLRAGGSLPKNVKKDDVYYGIIMDMVVIRGSPIFEACKASLHDAVQLKKEHRSKTDIDSTLHVSVSALGSYKELGTRACSFSPIQPQAAENAFKVAVESAESWLKIDAMTGMLRTLVDSNRIVEDVVSTFDPNTIYAAISDSVYTTLYGLDETNDLATVDAMPGTVLSLVGKIAFPCVCEVPPSSAPLFSEAGAKVVSQGITWQSLYLVLLGNYFMLAEPEKHSNGEGRVVTSCKLENLEADRDPENARMDTAARRLMLVHSSPDFTAPGLFRFEKPPTPQENGPFLKWDNWSSSLDIWFEDSRAVQLAVNKVQEKIIEARGHRGSFVRRYLARGKS